ncbi:hypothetical protein AALO_G00301090 [Alosa alosa]|uniref:C2H2-type domain-containing protein n=2 Tax=Alosa alosa TaxID=278164 RepID=A0AAV6FEI7_9TELE|nr:zinc finger and BTB domain-containing protein 42-like isoform X1 [Alosa alosa]KAG5261193.1 hypothetical protein AALO_G00301090 [Alosa alosa]
MASEVYTVDMVLQTHVRGILDAVVNVLVEEMTDIFRTCFALEQNGGSHAGSYIGFTDPAELQHRLRKSLKSIRQSGPSPGCDKPLSTAIRTPTPPSVSRQASRQVLPQCSSAHDVYVADSKVMTDLPVVIETFADAHTLFSSLTSGQNEREVQHGLLELGSQAPLTVHAQTECKVELEEEKPLTAQTPSEEHILHSGSEGESRLTDSSTPPTEGSVSSLSAFPLKMEVEATPSIAQLDKSEGASEAEIVDVTPPQPSTPDGHLACPTESGKSPDHEAPAVVIMGASDVRKGLEEVKRWPNKDEEEDEKEVKEEEDGSYDMKACLSGSKPNITLRSSGSIVKVGAEQVERAGKKGGIVPLLPSCPSTQFISLPLPSCSVQLDRLPPRLTLKKKTLLVCQDCTKVFRCVKSLHKHRRFHSGETPFHCPQCPRKFILRKSLRRHLRRHTGEKPYRCPHCGKAFRLHKGLEKHMHGNSRPGPC